MGSTGAGVDSDLQQALVSMLVLCSFCVLSQFRCFSFFVSVSAFACLLSCLSAFTVYLLCPVVCHWDGNNPPQQESSATNERFGSMGPHGNQLPNKGCPCLPWPLKVCVGGAAMVVSVPEMSRIKAHEDECFFTKPGRGGGGGGRGGINAFSQNREGRGRRGGDKAAGGTEGRRKTGARMKLMRSQRQYCHGIDFGWPPNKYTMLGGHFSLL